MGVCDVPVISSVCDAVGEGAASLVAAPFDWLAQAMGAAAGWLFEAVWSVFDTTTLVDVTKPGYIAVYNLLFGIAVFVMLIFFCLQLITGLIRRDPTALTRAALGAAKSILGSFVAIGLTGLLLEITDQLAVGIVQATGNTMEGMGDRIALLAAGFGAINIVAPGVGAIITIFLAGLAISAAAIVWFSLLIRKALLLVAIVFAPIALAGFSWDATKGWFGKWATFVIALILLSQGVIQSFHSGAQRRNLVMPPTTTRPPSTTAIKVKSTMGSCVMGIWSHVIRPNSQWEAGVVVSDMLSLFCRIGAAER